MVSCNWNAPGPVFLQSSDSVVEELLTLLFRQAICHADNVSTSKLPLCMGCRPHLIHGSLGPPKSTPQTASRSVQPVFARQTNWQTDRPCYSVCKSRPHQHSSEIWPNKLYNNVGTDGTNQWHNISEIYDVHLYWSMNFLNAPRTYNTHHITITMLDINVSYYANLVIVVIVTNWHSNDIHQMTYRSAISTC